MEYGGDGVCLVWPDLPWGRPRSPGEPCSLWRRANSRSVPDFRGLIKQDQELLQRIPAEQTARRAELQRTIDVRIDDLIKCHRPHPRASCGGRRLSGRLARRGGVSVRGVVRRDLVGVPRSRSAWLPTFIVLILLAVLTAAYAMRGVIRSLSKTVRPHHRQR